MIIGKLFNLIKVNEIIQCIYKDMAIRSTEYVFL